MKIIIDARELRTSSGRYVERLLHYLKDLDDMNDYDVLLKPKDMDGWDSSKNFCKQSCSIKEFSFSEQIKLKEQLRKQRADLVHFTFPQQPIWYRGRTITTIHDLTTLRYTNPSKNLVIFKFKQKVFSYVIKRSVKKATKVITPSEFVKNDLVKLAGIDPDKVIVTYESADPINDESEPIINLQNKSFIMYVGRPTPHKNLDRLIEAFSILQVQHPKLFLVLAGKKDSNYKNIEKIVMANGLKNVIFTDFVNEGQLKWLYQNCKAYVFPSLSEGFGLPGLEAMLNGAPVISSSATCLPEIYGDAAMYFDPLKVEDISACIDSVLNNNNLRKDLISKGKLQAAKYSWERMARQTLIVYKQSLK